MEDERIVPALVSLYKAEVWRHLGFCGNVRSGTAARVPPRCACRVSCEKPSRGGRQGRFAAATFSRVGGVLCSWGSASRRGLGDSTRNINTDRKTCEIQVERF